MKCPLDRDALHLVALSGGADSVALLLSLRALGYRVEAAHCNFHLRGEESDRDEAFCKLLCESKEVKLHLAHFDTRAFASLRRMSIEMAARELRYDWFRRLAHDIGAADICVGHHLEDSAETVILNLVRGTGIHGLAGIQPLNDGVARPMLGCTRKEIEEYLRRVGQNYVVDSTNMEEDAQRNKIRLSVVPLLCSINTAAQNNIARTAEYVGEACRVFDSAIEQSVERIETRDFARICTIYNSQPAFVLVGSGWRCFHAYRLLRHPRVAVAHSSVAPIARRSYPRRTRKGAIRRHENSYGRALCEPEWRSRGGFLRRSDSWLPRVAPTLRGYPRRRKGEIPAHVAAGGRWRQVCSLRHERVATDKRFPDRPPFQSLREASSACRRRRRRQDSLGRRPTHRQPLCRDKSHKARGENSA